jgi:hypothetical protein
MVQLPGFSADEHESQNFDVLPKGDYTVAIIASDAKATNAGDGYYLKFTLQVLDGEFKGRKIWDQLMIEHPKELAVKIGKARLADYCRAVGKNNPQDTSELHDVAIRVRLKIRKDEQYGDKNEVQSVLWKETTKPNVGALTGEKTAKKSSDVDVDDLPF